MLEPVAPYSSGVCNLPGSIHGWCLSPEDSQAIPPNCWKRTDEKPPETAAEIGGAHDFVTHTKAADALLFGHSVGPSRVSTARNTFIRGWAGVLRASVELCCDPAMTRALTVLHTWHTSSWNWNVCLMMFHGDFRSFSPKENMQGHSFEVACNHSSQLHGSWVHFVSPSLNLCICNRIAMTFKDNKNWWKDCLAMSAEAHASLLVKAIFPANIQSAVTTKVHVHVISMWTSQEHLRLSWCKLAQVLAILCKVNLASIWTIDALTYCTANNIQL